MDAYEKVQVVGRGAHGTCWLCIRKDDEFQRKVIVKTIPLDGMTADEETEVMRTFLASLKGLYFIVDILLYHVLLWKKYFWFLNICLFHQYSVSNTKIVFR